MGPREAAQNAEPKGNAKTLRQKDRIRTTLRKVRAFPHTKGATDRRCPRRKGISRVRTEAKRRSVFLLLFLCFVKALPKAFSSSRRLSAVCSGPAACSAVQIKANLIISNRRNTHELRQNLQLFRWPGHDAGTRSGGDPGRDDELPRQRYVRDGNVPSLQSFPADRGRGRAGSARPDAHPRQL